MRESEGDGEQPPFIHWQWVLNQSLVMGAQAEGYRMSMLEGRTLLLKTPMELRPPVFVRGGSGLEEEAPLLKTTR